MSKYNEDTIKVDSPKDTIICKGCPYSENDIKKGNIILLKGFLSRRCVKYPDGKPYSILFKNEKCPFRI